MIPPLFMKFLAQTPIPVSDKVPELITSGLISKCFNCSLQIAESWVDPFIETANRLDLEPYMRLAAFLAQTSYESNDFHELEENLNYHADRLLVVFPKRFANLTEASAYEHQPQKIANRVYANLLGNGNEASGDGWRYRGQGLINLTGKSNYDFFGKMIGVDLVKNPDILQQPKYACLVSGAFWNHNQLNHYADLGDFDRITKIINGGRQLGATERSIRYHKALELLTLKA